MSNVIKSASYIALEDKRTIEAHIQALRLLSKKTPGAAEHAPPVDEHLAEAKELSRQILQDAEAQAERCIREAVDEAAELKEQARAEIERWWEERRTHDEEHIAQARESGYERGYRDGLSEAENAVRQQYADMIAEARAVLEQAYSLKQQIIQEAEPFLIEVSCAIAEKIIDHQLTISREWILDSIKKLLTRRREQGIITLCVSPQQFSYIQNAREELKLVLDSQAELQILPDPSVQDHGCVLRTSFGSIDGRIDTQLHEIKTALKQIAMQNEGAPDET